MTCEHVFDPRPILSPAVPIHLRSHRISASSKSSNPGNASDFWTCWAPDASGILLPTPRWLLLWLMRRLVIMPRSWDLLEVAQAAAYGTDLSQRRLRHVYFLL